MSRYESKTTGIEPYIIDCMCLNISEKEALAYLKDKGYDISSRTYYRLKEEVKESTHERLNLIASKEFLTQHIERIDQLEILNQEMWSSYRKENDNFKRVLILEKIVELQTYISPYYDVSRYVMEESIKANETEKNNSIPV